MKQELTDEHRIALVQYRFERAYQTLKEADYMCEGGFYNATINRLYYACFYAASGLLTAKGIDANTHSGVKTMLSLHFIRTGLLDIEHGSTFSNLFDKRHSSDYEDFAYCDLDLVNYLRPKAEVFIKTAEILCK